MTSSQESQEKKAIDFPYISIIPYQVMANKNLTPSAKLHFGCLSALSKKVGYCYATDGQLAKMHEVDESQIKRWNKSLEEAGYISREVKSVSYRDKDGRLLWKKSREIYVGDGFSKKDYDKCKNAPIIDKCKNAPLIYKDNNNKSLIEKLNVPNPPKGSKPDISFSLSNYKFINISEEDHKNWKILYPTIDISRELLKSEEWLKANQTKAKLKKKWREFLRKWLQKAEDTAFNRKAYFSNSKAQMSNHTEANAERDSEYRKIKPTYDNYTIWYENLNDSSLMSKGKLILTETCFYDYNAPEYKYNLKYDKFMDLLANKYQVPSYVLGRKVLEA